MLKKKNGFTLIEMLTVIAIIAILAAILFPVYGISRRKARATQCLNNMTQIGKILKSYLADNNDSYPANKDTSGQYATEVPLSTQNGANLVTMQNGINWVEACYKYGETASTDPNAVSAWVCPSASVAAGGPGAGVTYAINPNMLEVPDTAVRSVAQTVLLREMDRRYGAVCRPLVPTNSPDTRPQFAFLGATDQANGASVPCNQELHSNGSNVVFADTHVKFYPKGILPSDSQMVWDEENKQWIAPDKSVTINP